MAWLMLVVAGLFETGFAVLLKQSHGITRVWPTVGFAACALISFALLTMALKKLEVGSAYAVWTGPGTVTGTASEALGGTPACLGWSTADYEPFGWLPSATYC
jgi:quaternary ammonium compound-resistance protein SugE